MTGKLLKDWLLAANANAAQMKTTSTFFIVCFFEVPDILEVSDTVLIKYNDCHLETSDFVNGGKRRGEAII